MPSGRTGYASAKTRIEHRDVARVRVPVRAAADRDVVLRHAADIEVTERDSVSEDRDAVHRLPGRDDDPQVADRDVHRCGALRIGTVDEEDGVGRDRIAVD